MTPDNFTPCVFPKLFLQSIHKRIACVQRKAMVKSLNCTTKELQNEYP